MERLFEERGALGEPGLLLTHSHLYVTYLVGLLPPAV